MVSLSMVCVGGSVTKSISAVKMPAPIERCVRKQNVLYLHNRNQFSAEYFRFMRRLLMCNISHGQMTADDKLVGVAVVAVNHSVSHIICVVCFSFLAFANCMFFHR